MNKLKELNKRFLKIPKRLRFFISVFLLSLSMLVSTLFYFDKAVFFLPLLIILSYSLTYFSLLEEIERFEWYSLFFIEVVLTASFYLFFFLFPARWLTRLPFILLYGVSLYAALLCSNIFNVGVEKSLQLYRAAYSVNFFYQTLVMFLVLNIIFSFKLNFLINGILIGVSIFLFTIQLLWTVRPKIQLEKEIVRYAMLSAILIGEAGMMFSFVPLKASVFSLFLTASYYSMTGLAYHYLDQRLFKETIREYLTVLAFTFVIMVLTISW
ncbi:hypothetical protein HY214_03540 [Candidatus Roizmanbacteria bacterium]|nr:hypothetical protein [Candidatus Roizmanbacteria bacterium]